MNYLNYIFVYVCYSKQKYFNFTIFLKSFKRIIIIWNCYYWYKRCHCWIILRGNDLSLFGGGFERLTNIFYLDCFAVILLCTAGWLIEFEYFYSRYFCFWLIFRNLIFKVYNIYLFWTWKQQNILSSWWIPSPSKSP